MNFLLLIAFAVGLGYFIGFFAGVAFGLIFWLVREALQLIARALSRPFVRRDS